MSNIFGSSFRSISAGVHNEGIERCSSESSKTLRNSNTQGFASSKGLDVNIRNASYKSRLFQGKSKPSETYEEISAIEYESNEDVDALTTSASLFRPNSQTCIKSSNFSDSKFKFSRNQCLSGVFRPAPREALFNSRLQHQNQSSNLKSNVNNTLVIRNFGLSRRNPLHSFFTKKNYLERESDNDAAQNISVNSKEVNALDVRNSLLDSHFQEIRKFNSGTGYQNVGLLPRNFELGSRNTTVQNSSVTEENSRVTHNSLTSFRGIKAYDNGHSRFRYFEAEEKAKYNEDHKNYDSCFVRPMYSREIRPRNSIISSNLGHSRFKPYSRSLNITNEFNVNHISKKELDTLSESRFLFNNKRNQIDNRSVSESIVSSTSAKDQFVNMLESLHHSILNKIPVVHVEFIRKEFDKVKEMLNEISEVSFVPNDAASVISHSSKFKHSVVPETHSRITNSSISLKNGQEILNTIVSKNKCQNSYLLPSIEEERKVMHSVDNQLSEDEKDASVFLFKKPRPYFKTLKNRAKTQKSPKGSKKMHSEENIQIINLKKWYPIAFEQNLAFCGTNESGTSIQTEAVKKRINNRKLELINGSECNILGSPSEKIFVLPETIASQLKNGLTLRWRIFQKELLQCQKSIKNLKSIEKSDKSIEKNKKSLEKDKKSNENIKKCLGRNKGKEEKIQIYDTTPKSIRKECFKQSSKKNNSPSPKKKNASIPANVKKSFFRKTVKEKQVKSLKIKSVKTPGNKELTVLPKTSTITPLSSETKTNSVCQTRSGRIVKQLQAYNSSRKKEVDSSKVVSSRVVSSTDDFSKKNSKNSPKKKVYSDVDVIEFNNDSKVQLLKKEKRSLTKRNSSGKRKRDIPCEADTSKKKKKRSEDSTEINVDSTVVEPKEQKKKKENKIKYQKKISPIKRKSPKVISKNEKKIKRINTSKNSIPTVEPNEFEDDFELYDLEIPEVRNANSNTKLSRSQLRLVSMETPPLKYFNNNLKLLKTVTPVQSPNWCTTQRTESEVKQFQKRRALAHKKKAIVEERKVVTKIKNLKTKDLKNVLDWVTDKAVRSPAGSSQLLQYMIPSRKAMEVEDESEDGNEDDRDLDD